MPGENLTRIEAEERAALVTVHDYDVVLDVTTGPEVFRSTTTVRFAAIVRGAQPQAAPSRIITSRPRRPIIERLR